MPKFLQSYNPHKINLIFHGFDIKVEEPNKSIALNQYAASLFTRFSIDSPEFKNKKRRFFEYCVEYIKLLPKLCVF